MIQLLFVIVLNFTCFSKSEYFKVFTGSDEASMNRMMEKIEKNTECKDQMAYLGALMMKKADCNKNPKEKLKLFKEGKDFLEKMILKNGENAEYRFLRLMIQENSPKVLRYNNKIKEDAKFVSNNLSSINPEVKNAILNYSKRSSVLKL